MICKECENEDGFDEEDGFIYCRECGVRVDDIIATAVDDEDLVGEGGGTRGATYNPIHTRRRPSQLMDTPSQPRFTEERDRYSQFRSQLKSALPSEPADFGSGSGASDLSYESCYKQTRDRYVHGFVMMVTYQCDALVEKFNVTPLIIGLVAPICLRFVALSGVFDDDWADKAIHESELQSKETKIEVREGKRRNRDKGVEHRNFDGKRAVMIWLSQLRKSLPLSSSLAISFLACHKARAPVLPTDLVRWAREGTIPYQSCFLKIQERMGVRSAACPVDASTMFRPDHVISAQVLETRAASIADIIGLLLPPVNLYGIASNYLKRLSVPEDKVLDLVRLIQRWSMPPDLYLCKNEYKLPTRVCVMSILTVAIRMVYNINGFGVWERSNDVASEADVVEPDSPVHDDDDVSETESVDAELPDVEKATELDTEELLKNLDTKYYELADETDEYEKDLLSYLSHGKNELFAGLAEASADDTYRTVDNLWNGYPKDDGSERVCTPLKRGRDREDDKLSDGNSPRSKHARKSGTGSIDCDEPSLECVPSPDNHHHNQEKKSKESAIRRLITDMGENFFVYIPPRVRVKRQGYLHYLRKKDDGELIYRAHADYYILLRVCARVAEIDPRNMHRGVLSFERRLAWMEKRIDHVLRLKPPIKKCKLCRKDDDKDDDKDGFKDDDKDDDKDGDKDDDKYDDKDDDTDDDMVLS
ncbi:hypothetical protein EUTSA_v10027666mg [Eutrema salsugineum]|uniref:Rrn7/TAF1B N-terminal cyclin domain-containing protein n=2 Tax=Eutrema salsugineum TaxID=72664 RepID=V4LAD9_EUTSA|nr:hypothetical protein EUTSA_v10027666mg [Eutrema salsugineum]